VGVRSAPLQAVLAQVTAAEFAVFCEQDIAQTGVPHPVFCSAVLCCAVAAPQVCRTAPDANSRVRSRCNRIHRRRCVIDQQQHQQQ
jgi:hypothetical protein